jgi:hypothetical protein
MNRVVVTIGDARNARAAIEALLDAGVDRENIDILHGKEDLHRLDPSGDAHGFLAQFRRTLIRLAGPVEESAYLRHHVEDVRAGRFVIMVLAKNRDRRELAAGILRGHSAEFIGFYGRWVWRAMRGPGMERPETSGPHSQADLVYETELDGVAMRLRFDLKDAIVDAAITRPDGTVHHTRRALRPLW